MKNIFKSLFLIIAVVAVTGGATYSYFSDTATVSGSTFSAGTLDIKVDANPSSSVQQWEDSFAVPSDYFVKDLYPGFPTNGEQNWQIIDLKNVGTINGNATIKLNRTSAWNELASQLTFTVLYDEGNNGTFVSTGVSGVLDAFTGTYTIGALDANSITSVKIVWTLPTSAGNNVQGDSVTFDAVFGLTQTN